MVVLRLILIGVAMLAFVLFAVPNWHRVSLFFGSTEVVTPLALLLLLTFLGGGVPVHAAHRIARARWSSRLARAAAVLPPVASTADGVASTPMSAPRTVTSEAQLTAVPPACG